jgi:hypothetical protein
MFARGMAMACEMRICLMFMADGHTRLDWCMRRCRRLSLHPTSTCVHSWLLVLRISSGVPYCKWYIFRSSCHWHGFSCTLTNSATAISSLFFLASRLKLRSWMVLTWEIQLRAKCIPSTPTELFAVSIEEEATKRILKLKRTVITGCTRAHLRCLVSFYPKSQHKLNSNFKFEMLDHLPRHVSNNHKYLSVRMYVAWTWPMSKESQVVDTQVVAYVWHLCI